MYFKDIIPSKKVIYDLAIIDFLSSNEENNLSIIYFSNKEISEIQKLSRYKDNIIFISKFTMPFQCFSLKHINNKILKHLSNKIVIAIDLDNNVSYTYMKYLINNLIHLFKIMKKHNIEFRYTHNNSTILSVLSCTSTHKYFEDICMSFNALLSNSKKKQYEIVYDYVCNYLDNEFTCKNICGFSNDVCNASRAGLTKYKLNGCCYTINYGPGGIIREHTPCKYLVDRHCIANCISCKLHTCYYLKIKNIQFKINDILLLKCFFSYKQHFVLKYNVFKTREEILEKLLHVNFIPFIIYYPLALYKIN